MARAVAALVVAAGGGLALAAAFPPYGWWWVAPLAVATLTGLTAGRRPRTAAGLAGLFGLAFFLPLLHWSGTYVGALPWVLLAVSQAAFLLPLGALLPVVARLPAGPVWGAALWVAEEAARGRVPFGGFPWGRLAFSQGHTLYTGLAAVGGAPLVTFAVALTGTLLAAAVGRLGGGHPVGAGRFRRRRRRERGLRPAPPIAPPRGPNPRTTPAALRAVAPLGTAALALGVLLAGPAARPAAAAGSGQDTRSQATVAVVQGNVPRLGLDFNAQRAAVLANHVQATLQLAAQVAAGRLPRPALVVWPENSSDIDPAVNPDAAAAIDRAAAAVGVPILVGTLTAAPGNRLYNEGLVWTPGKGPVERYVKRHPVPFGEYIPLRSVARLFSSKVDLVRRDFAAGRRPGVLTMNGITVGDVICFEVAYDGLVRDVVRGGAGLIVVQTNNATFGRSAETYQQLAMSQLRAVEQDRTVLVAATSGISAIIGPDGQIRQRSQIFTRDLLVQRVPVGGPLTLATRLGAWPEWLLTAAALLAAAGGLAGRWRARSGRRA